MAKKKSTVTPKEFQEWESKSVKKLSAEDLKKFSGGRGDEWSARCPSCSNYEKDNPELAIRAST